MYRPVREGAEEVVPRRPELSPLQDSSGSNLNHVESLEEKLCEINYVLGFLLADPLDSVGTVVTEPANRVTGLPLSANDQSLLLKPLDLGLQIS
jgi:hypothetical protein